MNIIEKKDEQPHPGISRNIVLASGITLIASGAAILLEQTLKTGWLPLLILPAVGLTFLFGGIRSQKLGFIIPGGIITGLGIGAFLFFTRLFEMGWLGRVGMLVFAFGLGWCLIPLLSYFYFRKIAWWALLTGMVVASTGLVFLVTPMRITDFIFYITTALGICFLAWGITERLIGLIIPGSLLVAIGPGIAAAWGGSLETNALASTGIMLVSFALGWGLITLFSRVLMHQFVWWPLIPGGVLAMVGWGLYIGGNPGNALSFIGNTGSIGLIIFGVYLLLLRRGIHR